jgi:16S rRNA C967 or C1407 C5-methylase (RsmB/RsmF family)/NOL1/NOP2/fmu family ribosome biogenesis protein
MNLPEAFVKRTERLLGKEYLELEKALEESPPISIRVNNKIEYRPSENKVPWCESGYYLNERPLFTADPLFHAGAYYVQEASSMFLEQVAKQHLPNAQTVLDLCAAPGGKSTLLSQTISESSLLVSNEIIPSRAHILAENLIKWGNPNIVVTNNKPSDFASLTGFFDAILVDAPCSGEGMFRKDKGAIQEWSENIVTLCAARQREIVSSVWNALKENGILVYSTCTFNREENEENVKWMCKELGAELLPIDLHGNNEITTSDVGYRFYPHKTKGEGFFISVFKKKSGQNLRNKNRNIENKNIKFVSKFEIPTLSLTEPERWSIIKENNLIKAYDKKRINDFLMLNRQLKCIHSGVLLGEFKGSDFIPSECMALSKKLDLKSVEIVDVEYNTAISFLKKETIFLTDSKLGYVLICYKGLGLGWVKNLGNRCNNLYPREWRIRIKID